MHTCARSACTPADAMLAAAACASADVAKGDSMGLRVREPTVCSLGLAGGRRPCMGLEEDPVRAKALLLPAVLRRAPPELCSGASVMVPRPGSSGKERRFRGGCGERWCQRPWNASVSKGASHGGCSKGERSSRSVTRIIHNGTRHSMTVNMFCG